MKEISLACSLDVRMCGTCDHLGVFPQSIVYNSCTIFHGIAQAFACVYALVIRTSHAVTLD